MQASQLAGQNQALVAGALTATGGETVYDTTVAIKYLINGLHYSKSAITDGAIPTTDVRDGAAFDTIAASKACVLGLFLDASGNVKATQSAQVDVDSSGSLARALEIEDPGSGYALFGSIVIKAGSSASTFTIGTSNWNATGITLTVRDHVGWPARPFTS